MTISYQGDLWRGNTTPAIKKAAQETQRFAKFAIAARTPVRTGQLKANWQVDVKGNGLNIRNETKYAIFVEYGTRRMAPRKMLTKSLPAIEQTFKQALAREIGKSLGARVISAATGRGFGGAEQVGLSRAERIVRQPAAPTYERLTGRS